MIVPLKKDVRDIKNPKSIREKVKKLNSFLFLKIIPIKINIKIRRGDKINRIKLLLLFDRFAAHLVLVLVSTQDRIDVKSLIKI